MKSPTPFRLSKVILALALPLALAVAGVVVAQRPAPSTDSGGPPVESPGTTTGDAQPDGPMQLPEQDPPPPAATDGEAAPPETESPWPGGFAPDENPAGPNAPGAPSATFSYYMVSGATLRGRSSTTTQAYDNIGCIHLTAGSSLIVNTEMQIPDGSIIKFLRVIYNDTSATDYVRGYLTRYTPGQATNDLVSVSSSAAFATGYGFAVSAEITETVNNISYAYTLIGWPTAASSAAQICGLRIAYYAPGTSTFLPTIEKNVTSP